MMYLTDEQLLQVALAYQVSGTDMSAEDFLENVSTKYENIKKIYKTKRNGKARIGDKSKLGI